MSLLDTYRFERRIDADARRSAVFRVYGAAVALIVAGFLLLITGRNPFRLFGQAIDAVFGDQAGIEAVCLRAIPILMCALGVALSLRMKVWNIGSDGQFLMGAFAAVGLSINSDLPRGIELLVMAGGAALAGALWILVPALARAYWGVNEIITTLLLNFVAIQLVTWASLGFWRDKEAAVVQGTKTVDSILPALPGTDNLTVAFLVPLLICAMLGWVFRSTVVGYEIDTIGGNPRAAGFAGINVRRRILTVMLVTGAIAGLAGMLQLSAPGAQRLNAGFSNNYGLSGFIVAALAGGSFVGLLIAGFFIAAMFHAGLELQTKGLSVYIIFAIYGIVLIGIAVGEILARYRLVKAESSAVIAAPEVAT